MYELTLGSMDTWQATLARRVPPPKKVVRGRGYVFRYEEKNIHQALVQKLARIVSGLRAARLLLENGFFQELGTIQRTLDEFNEDVSFLAYGVIYDMTELHCEYLGAFFEEEFDDPLSSMNSTQRRPMLPRKKIRAYIARIQASAGLNPSLGTEVMRTIDKMYSGFVHGASPHIMDMYYGEPPYFHLGGMLGTHLESDHRNDLWNYFYRSIASFVMSTKAFGDEPLCQSIIQFMRDFARAEGEDYTRPPDGFK